jgi:GNAT superfamily N-acetyltransferase
MPDWPLDLMLAVDDNADFTAIIRLIQEAADWLRTMGTDQWATPWPNEAGRDSRVRAALHQRKTWICWDQGIPAATITIDPDEDPYWAAEDREQPAVYVHRLVVSRKYGGYGLGRDLLNWAGLTGRREHEAKWIRVSAWTDNKRLHRYYEKQGFARHGYHPDDGYPSRARFQKPTARLADPSFALFRLAEPG